MTREFMFRRSYNGLAATKDDRVGGRYTSNDDNGSVRETTDGKTIVGRKVR